MLDSRDTEMKQPVRAPFSWSFSLMRKACEVRAFTADKMCQEGNQRGATVGTNRGTGRGLWQGTCPQRWPCGQELRHEMVPVVLILKEMQVQMHWVGTDPERRMASERAAWRDRRRGNERQKQKLQVLEAVAWRFCLVESESENHGRLGGTGRRGDRVGLTSYHDPWGSQVQKCHSVPQKMLCLDHPLLSLGPILLPRTPREHVSHLSGARPPSSLSLPLCCQATLNASRPSAQRTMAFQLRAWEGWRVNPKLEMWAGLQNVPLFDGGTEKDLQQTKRRYTFHPGGITEPSIKILARSIKVDDTDIVDGTRQWDILETECDKRNIYQEKHSWLRGGICLLLWDIMQLSEETCKIICLVWSV